MGWLSLSPHTQAHALSPRTAGNSQQGIFIPSGTGVPHLRALEARGLHVNYPDALQGSQGLWNNNILIFAHFQ